MLLKCKIDKKDLDIKDKVFWRWKLKAVFVYKSVYKSEHKKVKVIIKINLFPQWKY